MTDARSQPICATPPADLLRLADWIDEARNAYLDAITRGPGGEVEKRVLANRLWDDKGTFAPALRQAAEAASLRAKVDELTAVLHWIEAHDRMWCQPEYEKGNEVLDRSHVGNILIRGSYGAAANLTLKALAVNSQHSDGEVGR